MRESQPDVGGPWSRAWWLGAVLIVLPYLPTLTHPFDFIDDGCLVYSGASVSPGELPALVWDHTLSDFHERGPFRPVFWAHCDGAAHLAGPHALPRRALRLGWELLAVVLWLRLLRGLGGGPVAGLLRAAGSLLEPP